MKMMQRIVILILITFWFSNLTLCQIKSERQVKYWLYKKADKRGFHKNTSKDSCVIFWEEYNQSGKIIKEYDFPSDMCWQIDGPWVHYYFYDNKDRLIEHRSFGGEEGKVKTLMRDPVKINDVTNAMSKHTPYTIKKDMRYLSDEGLIKKLGKARGTIYLINEKKKK